MRLIHKSGFLYICIVMLAFFGGIAVGWLLQTPKDSEDTQIDKPELRAKGKLTSPLLSCDTTTELNGKEYDQFSNLVVDKINKYIFSKKASQISVYFRELNNGSWFGVNEKENFSPASLLKVPIMIALLKAAEKDPKMLDEKLLFKETLMDVEPYYKDKQIEIGYSYPVSELIERMIIYSNNEAMKLLLANFDKNIFNSIYSDLGMSVPDDNNPEDFMTVKTYAAFFRILFNASYLNVADSEKALEMLSKVVFKEGLINGIPHDITFAHKFGERLIENGDSDIKQLHDCGIIYYPDNPYLLCIMTRGTDYKIQSSIIREISKLIWDEVSARNPRNKTK